MAIVVFLFWTYKRRNMYALMDAHLHNCLYIHMYIWTCINESTKILRYIFNCSYLTYIYTYIYMCIWKCKIVCIYVPTQWPRIAVPFASVVQLLGFEQRQGHCPETRPAYALLRGIRMMVVTNDDQWLMANIGNQWQICVLILIILARSGWWSLMIVYQWLMLAHEWWING